MALYRKYRPATFAEVVGQEHVTVPLSTALDTGRINHAYLFSGPRGCGKTSSARILARSLNCVEGPTSTPCGKCSSCIALGPGGGGNLDVTELDAASHGGVDDTRELRDRAFYAPAESRYRIFIIDEAHMVTTQGFNALLKIVEEPPEHLIFVFATTEPEKVLPTIRSRTHHYPFRLLAPTAMRGLLEEICTRENVPVADAVYPLVIRAGGGSPRDSLSVMDQLLAGAGPEGVTYERALALLGVTDVALIDEAVDALAAADGAALFGTVEKIMDAGHDPRRFAADLLERFRDLILMRTVPDAPERGLIDVPGDVLERMRDEASRIGPATLTRYAEIVHAGLGEMRGATAPRLLLEVMCARMLLPAASDTDSAVLQRLERLEQGIVAARPAAPPARTIAADVPEDAGAPPQAVGAPDDAATRFQRPSQRQAAPAPQPDTAAPAAPTASPAPVPAVPPAPDRNPAPTATPAPNPDAERPEHEEPPAPRVPGSVPAPQRTPEPEPVAAQEVAPQAAEVPAPVAAGPDAAAIRAVWSEVRAKVRDRSRTVEVMLSGATVREVDGNRVVLVHDSAPLVKRLAEPRNATVIAAALGDVFGGTFEVTCLHGSAPAVPVKAAPAQAPSRQSGQPRFSRPSQAKQTPPPAPPVAAGPSGTPAGPPVPRADDDIPPPEAPDLPDDPGPEPGYVPLAPPDPSAVTPEDVEQMFADAATPGDPSDRRDPEEVAIELLEDVLGAKRLDEK
ncbi:DNA polymerase III subunit gamma and tau [Rhodococcus coprophilus]|uniref:DNA polymerase III subunit gamma/tau n=1 Tax=Rhodococcus coprophilus TaxID=38310 RepID=A0A2X4X0L3_9NOCA|nr:DNA polymerase III subunit gamma and tau [Rhodococcus coprophilus]MBM7458559.1 DNA polymerase-3 subunit gamma/tau [Rhodococcus coprophilus]SQI32865.1 DNA polymerase III gamma subunit [Rhodococcus coprophilus]